jgi:hypothetical protein
MKEPTMARAWEVLTTMGPQYLSLEEMMMLFVPFVFIGVALGLLVMLLIRGRRR